MGNNHRMKYTPDIIDSLESNQVYVFTSNLIGYHSGETSLIALHRFGAIWGQAEGPQGQCYAIPVDIRGEAIDNVSNYLKRHIRKFLEYAKEHQEKEFLVTKIGCGIAGFDEDFIASFFSEALQIRNICLPKSFCTYLTEKL